LLSDERVGKVDIPRMKESIKRMEKVVKLYNTNKTGDYSDLKNKIEESEVFLDHLNDRYGISAARFGVNIRKALGLFLLGGATYLTTKRIVNS
jgi:hypothetical protein